MRRPGNWALLLVVVVLTAGCTAPTHDGTPTAAERQIEVNGLGLPVDPDVVFDRVRRMLNASVPRPQTIQVVGPPDPSDSDQNRTGGGFDPAPAFFEVLGVDTDRTDGLNASQRRALENGRTDLRFGTLLLYTGANDSRTIEYVLAHEFVHYVQAARERPRQLDAHLDDTTDSRFVMGSLLEGSAVYATNAYIEAYLGGPPSTQLYEWLAAQVAPGSFQDYANTRYLLGSAYTASRVGAPAELDRIYQNPPRTGEQLIHNLEPGGEPPRPLAIEATPGGYRRIGTDRLGEGFLRVLLRNGVSTATANEAARGWGNDSLRTYRPQGGGQPAYVWAIRFDDGRNRSQFRAAIEPTLEELGTRDGAAWTLDDAEASVRLTGVSQSTVTLLVGPESFVRNATVSGSEGELELELPE